MPRQTSIRILRAVVGSATAVASLGVLHRLGTTHGSTSAERERALPGDDLVHCPQTVANHARTIGAPPDAVWPWLMQVGWHRGGWYTPRWVDVFLFPDNLPSASRLLEDQGDLDVGDFIPDGPPRSECGFVVRGVHPGRFLVLHSTTHLPLAWRRLGRRVAWSWAFVLSPAADGTATRLMFRWRARTHPWWLTAGTHLLMVPADFVMSLGMLRGLARRVEQQRAHSEPSGTTRRVS